MRTPLPANQYGQWPWPDIPTTFPVYMPSGTGIQYCPQEVLLTLHSWILHDNIILCTTRNTNLLSKNARNEKEKLFMLIAPLYAENYQSGPSAYEYYWGGIYLSNRYLIIFWRRRWYAHIVHIRLNHPESEKNVLISSDNSSYQADPK